MPDHYDVIIIGSGAGGGTLAHTLADAGPPDPHPRAGRLPAPGDGQLGPRAGVHRRQVHLQGHVVRRRRQAVPAPGPLLRRRRHEALRRRALPPPPAGLRRAAPRRRPLARLAARPTTTSSPGTRRPSSSTRSAATPARTRPRAPGPSRTRGPRCRTSRGSSTWPTTLADGRLPPVPRPVRDPARRGGPGQEHVHPLHVVRRLPVPGPRQGRRRDHGGASGARPAERDAPGRRGGRRS